MLYSNPKAPLSKENRAFIYFRFQGVCKPQQDIGLLRYPQPRDSAPTFWFVAIKFNVDPGSLTSRKASISSFRMKRCIRAVAQFPSRTSYGWELCHCPDAALHPDRKSTRLNS